MFDLVAEYKKRVRQIDRDLATPDSEATQLVPTLPKQTGRFNVHKRSLPVGTDKIVGMGFSRDEAIKALEGMFKAKNVAGRVIYYDIIPQGACEAEKSVYFNKRPFIIP